MNAPNPSTALARVLIDEFIRAGVRHACISPGSRSAPLALAIAERAELEKHVILDERSASFHALGIAKQTGIPALLACTSGTAAANFFPAVHEADRAGVPMLILTADRPPELRQTGANQTTDQIKIYGSSVRSFIELGAPESLPTSNAYWRSAAARAFSSATVACGPVHLNLAFREPLVPMGSSDGFAYDLDGRPGGAPWHREISPEPQVPREIVELVEGAERGLIVAGHLEEGGADVAELSAALGWPMVAEATSNARRSGLSVDHYDLILENERFFEAHRPDLVLRFGSAGLSKNLARLLGLVPQILIDRSKTWLDAGRTAEVRVHSGAGAFSRVARRSLRSSTPPEWAASWQAAAEVARTTLRKELPSDMLSEPWTARLVVQMLPAGAQLVVGASMPVRDVDNFSSGRSDVRLFANRGLNGIDGFVSSARGIAAASLSPTYALCGDLTFLHDQNGLLGTSREDRSLTYIVLNNSGGGIFSFLPQAELPEHFESVFGTPQPVDLSQLCGAHGIEHHLVQDATVLERLAAPSKGLRVIEVTSDRSENVELHRRLRNKVTAGLD